MADPKVRVAFNELPSVEGRGSTLGTEWWVAFSHLRSKKSEAFVSVVTVLSVLGVAAGVALLNCVIAVMTGFEYDLRDKILGANAHVVVFNVTGQIRDADRIVSDVVGVDGVEAAAPFVYSEMMVRSNQRNKGVIIKGIDLDRTADVTHLMEDLASGYTAAHDGILDFEDEDVQAKRALLASLGEDFPPIGLSGEPMPPRADDPLLPGMVIGKELRAHLMVDVGDRIQIINPLGGGAGPLGMPTPSVKSVRVAGVFDSGMYEYDTTWTYVPNQVLQDFLSLGDAVTGIEVRVEDIDAAESVAAGIDEVLSASHYAKHWKSLNAKLFEALAVEKWAMGAILNMIVVVAAMQIITVLLMVVITKGKEIAILKAMGATRTSIMRIFVMEGAAIGLVGTVLGTVGGLLGCAFLDGYEYPLETDVYYLDTLPVVVDSTTVVVIAVGAFVTCFLCTIYPAWRASSLDTVEALRYE